MSTSLASSTEAIRMLRVCVVSGDTAFARELARSLASDDIETNWATLSGVMSAPSDRTDIALLDLADGGINDDDVVAVRAHIRGPVIVLTIDARETSVIGPLAAGARGVVLRGSEAAVIEAAVRAVGDEGVYVEPAVGTTLAELVTLSARSGEETALTRTELRVLQRFPRGLTNAEIAEDLNVSINTVKTHVRHILAKLDCDDRMQAVQVAEDRGLLL